MQGSRENSPSVRSQISLDLDEQQQTHNYTAISQAQFATQIPITNGSQYHTLLDDLNQEENIRGTGDRQEILISELTSTNDLLQSLLTRPIDNKVQQTRIEHQEAQRGLKPKQTQPVASGTASSSGTVQTEDDLLTQQELRAPAAIHESESDKVEELVSQEQDTHTTTQTSLVQSYGLILGTDGRISWRMSTIPADQAQLLENDSKWFPSLIGLSGRLPTVPLPLLNSVTTQADIKPSQNSLVTGTDLKVEKVRVSLDTKSETRPVSQSNDDSEDSASELGDDQWPASPAQPQQRDRLPPDSPSEMEWTSGLPQHPQKDPPQGQTPLHRDPRHEPIEDTASISLRLHDQGPRQTMDLPPHSPRAEQVTRISQSSTRSKSQGLSISNSPSVTSKPIQGRESPKTIEVHRTPYPSKAKNSTRSPDTTTKVVPASFTEIHQSASTGDGGHIASSIISKGKVVQDLGDFENNSSEDNASPFHTIAQVQSPLTMKLKATPSGSTILHQSPHTGKRDRSNSDIDQEDRRKRKRLAQPSSSADFQTARSYSDIDAQKREQRRAFYHNLKQEDKLKQASSLPVQVKHRPANTTPTVEAVRRDQTAVISISSNPQSSISATRFSLEPPPEIKDRPSRNMNLPRASLNSKIHMPNLYLAFQAAYQNYRGETKDFLASCQLLKISRNKSKIHPSLLDAFVYRHYHDYRPYLHTVIEEAGTAMPYIDFFDEILDPGCTKRIITPAGLEDILQHPNSRPQVISTIARAQSEIVDGPHKTSSTTHEITTVKPSAREPDRIDERPGSQRSTQSVRAWLERAAGARSPILGTPEMNKYTEKEKSTPDDMQFQHDVRSAGKGKALIMQKQKAHVRPPTRAVHTTPSPVVSTTKGSKIIEHEKIDNKTKCDSQQAVRKSMTSAPPQEIVADTAFKRFLRDYANLPGEHGHRTNAYSGTFVDVFSWRRR